MQIALLVTLALATLALAFIVRSWRIGGPRAARVTLTGKTIVVTGTSLGSLGFETARVLALWGARVIVTTRGQTEAAADAIRSVLPSDARARIVAHPLDLSRSDSVAAFARWYGETIGESLDVLVNNAGIHLDLLSQWRSPRETEDGFEIQWRTNYLGTFHLTSLLLPFLRRAAAATGDARVVNVVSMLHRKGTNAGLFTGADPYDSWVAYGLSKLALVHATFALDRTHAPENIAFFCLHPGSVYTKVADKGLEGNAMLSLARKILSPFEAFFLKTPFEGAQTQIHCATAPSLASGRYYRECAVASASSEADDADVAARLVRETQAWVDAGASRTASA